VARQTVTEHCPDCAPCFLLGLSAATLGLGDSFTGLTGAAQPAAQPASERAVASQDRPAAAERTAPSIGERRNSSGTVSLAGMSALAISDAERVSIGAWVLAQAQRFMQVLVQHLNTVSPVVMVHGPSSAAAPAGTPTATAREAASKDESTTCTPRWVVHGIRAGHGGGLLAMQLSVHGDGVCVTVSWVPGMLSCADVPSSRSMWDAAGVPAPVLTTGTPTHISAFSSVQPTRPTPPTAATRADAGRDSAAPLEHFARAVQEASEYCRGLNVQGLAYDHMVRTLVMLMATGEAAPISVCAVLRALADSRQTLMQRCRVEWHGATLDDNWVFARGPHAVGPADCLGYLFAKHAALGLQMREDSHGPLVFDIRVTGEPSPTSIDLIIVAFDRNSAAAGSASLHYFCIPCVLDREQVDPLLLNRLAATKPASRDAYAMLAGRNSQVFEASNRVSKIHRRIAAHKFVEVLWDRPRSPDGPAPDEWMLLLAACVVAPGPQSRAEPDEFAAFSPEIKSFSAYDSTVGPLLAQLARLTEPLEAALAHMLENRVRVIVFPRRAVGVRGAGEGEESDARHLVLLHALMPHAYVVLRCSRAPARLRAYVLISRHLPTKFPGQAHAVARELVEETINALCTFLWNRLTH
jgi:hypothetical protein